MPLSNALRRVRDRRTWPWLIFTAAAGLLAWRLDQKNLWLDESMSWHLTTGSMAEVIRSTAMDIHPPLYYVLLKGWASIFGDSLAGLRSLSVVSGLIALGLMYRLGRRLLPFGVACAAMAWYALSPHFISYGQEARMYAPAVAAVLGACLAYRRWVDAGFESTPALVAYAACATAALYLHYFTALVLVAIWSHVLLLTTARYTRDGLPCRLRWRGWRGWLAAHVAMAAMYAPWAGAAFRQIAHGQYWRIAVTTGQIPAHASDLARMLMFGTYLIPTPAAGFVMLALAGAGLAMTVARACARRDDERAAFMALVALVPAILGLAALPFTGELNLARYLAYAAPLVILAAAYGLRATRLPSAVVVALLLVAGVTPLPSLAAYYRNPVRDFDTRPIVAYLNHAAHHGAAQPQDLILVAPGHVTYALEFVSRGDLEYQGIETVADLDRALPAPASQRSVWLVVGYGWPGFNQLLKDTRFEDQPVPASAPDRIRLLRLRAQ
jgi:uncharacterized membrane protein